MNRLCYGFLGTARVNDKVLNAIRQSARSEVVAIASRELGRAKSYAQEREIPRAYGAYDELLFDTAVDIVYVSLPNDLHAEWSERAALAGKHVLVEKPIALSPQEMNRLISASDSAGVVIQEACMMRFHPQTTWLSERVSSGLIGEPRWMRASFSYLLRKDVDIRLNRVGGGSLWDLGCYPVALFRATIGMSPEAVMGTMKAGPSGADLTFAAQLAYRTGAVGQFATSIEAAESWSAEIVGSEGFIRIGYPWLSHHAVRSQIEVQRFREADVGSASKHGETMRELVLFEDLNAYYSEVEAMEEVLLDGEPERFPLAESAENVGTLAELLESAKTNAYRSLQLETGAPDAR